MRISKALLVAASCLMLGTAPTLAQTAADVEQAAPAVAAKVKAKAKKKAAPKGKHAGAISIVNARADAVAAVSITNAKGKVVASVKKAIAPGKKVGVAIPGGNGCDFTVAARFGDGTEFEPTPVNLCRDKTLRFTDGEGGAPAEAPAPADDAQ